MARSLLVAFFAGAWVCCVAQGGYWMRGFGSQADDRVAAMEPLPGGDVIIAGSFSEFFQMHDTLLVTQGVTDAFVARIGDEGEVVWARSIGGPGVDRALDVAVDDAGRIAVVGQYSLSLQAGAYTLNSNNGSLDGFVARLDADGNVLWAASMGSPQNGDRASAVALAPDGSVLVGGDFSHTADFGGSSLTSAFNNLLNAPGTDVFLVRFSTGGALQWVRQGSAALEEECVAVACDGVGAAYMTGRYTDDITFQQLHANSQDDAAFVVKFDDAGNEAWFRRIAGGVVNRTADIEWHGSALYLAGHQSGNSIVFGQGNTPIGSLYPNSAFVVQFNDAGTVEDQWSFGSDNAIGAVDLSIGDTALVVGGWFECFLTQGEDDFGAGLFLSLQGQDHWIAELGTGGLGLGYVQQFGGHFQTTFNAVSLGDDERITAAGSYNKELIVAGVDSIVDVVPMAPVSGINDEMIICGDSTYGDFFMLDSLGKQDAYVVRSFMRERKIFDVFDRSTCDLSQRPSPTFKPIPPAVMIADTAFACGTAAYEMKPPFPTVFAPEGGSVAPWVHIVWQDGSFGTANGTDTLELLSATLTYGDDCYQVSDSGWASAWPGPPTPTISDDQGINTDCTACQDIVLCLPTNPELTGSPADTSLSYFWTRPDGTQVNDSIITAQTSGYYLFTTTNALGCGSSVEVQVILQPVSPLDNLTAEFEFLFPDDTDGNDTIVLCGGESVNGLVVHTIFQNGVEVGADPPGITAIDSVFTGSLGFLSTSMLPISMNPGIVTATAVNEGWYVWEYHYYLSNEPCSNDTYSFSARDSIYVDTLQTIYSTGYITGPILMCAGDTVTLDAVVDAAGTLDWGGDGIVGDTTAQSVQVVSPGYYELVFTPFDTSACVYGAADSHLINLDPAPYVTMVPADGLICPGDSVMLTSTETGAYQWYGPAGPLGSNSNVLYASVPGDYFVVLTGPAGCGQASNVLTVVNYSTPYIAAFPQPVLCNGGSVTLSVTAPTSNVLAQWLPPLSGTGLSQTVFQAGTYQCEVTVCGIATVATIEVLASSVDVQLITSGPIDICNDSTTLIQASPGLEAYLWLPSLETGESAFVGPGLHSVVGFDEYGCTDTAGVVVVNAIAFTDSLQAAAVPVCFGATATATATGSGTINWYSDAALAQPIGSGSSINYGPVLVGTSIYATQTENDCTSDPVVVPLPLLGFTDSIQGTVLPVCPGDTATLIATGSGSIAWFADAAVTQQIGSGNTIELGPINAPTSVWVVQMENGCVSSPVEVGIPVLPQAPAPDVFGDTVVCIGQVIQLNPVPPGVVHWEGPDGFADESPFLEVVDATEANEGWYHWSVVGANDCTSLVDSIFISVESAIDPGLPPSALICIGEQLPISAIAGFEAYAWSNGANTQSTVVTESGNYIVEVTSDQGCIGSDSIVVDEGPCNLDVPNIITPNGDGTNDIIDLDLSGFVTATFTIWNRWGQKLDEITAPRIIWNGRDRLTGEVVPSGTYFWTLSATRASGSVENRNGYVMVAH